MRTRVLMLGPGDGIVGGIRSLVEVIVPALQGRVDLQYLPTVRNRPASESGKLSPGNVTLALSQYARFLIALVSMRPQVVHVHTSEGLAWLKDTFYVFIAKAGGCRVIVHMHGGHFVELHERSSLAARWFNRTVLALADQVLEVSDGRAEKLARIVPKAHISVFHNCVDVAAMAEEEPHGSSAEACVLFLGTVGASKGVFDLLAAASVAKCRGHSLRLCLAGPPEQASGLDQVRSRAQDLDLADLCSVVGPVYGCHKARLIQECSIFALPSYQEALPMAILEAMAAGMPVVATRVGGVPEAVSDGYNGFLISPGDVEALADRLMILAAEPRLRMIMGQRGQKIVAERFDVGPYVERLAKLYAAVTWTGGTSGRHGYHEDPASHHQLPA